MHITFEKIKIKNFLTVGNYFINIALNKNALTLIYGKNGHGKSLVLDAISFALFNRPYRDINKPQLINSINKKELLVELYFDIGKSKYKIVRGMKPNIFEIHKDDILLNQEADSRDYQKYLEDHIIRMNQKSFNQKVIMGSASFVPFMKLKTPERRLVIEELLDLQIFTSMNVVLKQKIKNTEQLNENNDSNISQTKTNLKLQRSFLDEMKEDRQKQIQAIEIKVSELEEQISQWVSDMENNEKEISNLSEQINDKLKIENKIEEYKEIRAEINGKISALKEDLSFFTSSKDVCPTCQQEITEEFCSHKILETEQQISQAENALDKLKNNLSKKTNRLKEISEINNQIQTYNSSNRSLKNNISFGIKNLKTFKNEIKEIENKKPSKYNENALTELENILAELDGVKSELKNEKQIQDICLSLLKDNGIKAQIIKTYIPVINKLINQYMKEMQYPIQFELDENFNENIRSRNKETFTYNSFSEGQKLRINLALIFTWRMIAKMRSATTTNIIFFDEIMDSSLDQEGVDAFFRLLKTFEPNSNVFVISHNIELDRFPHKINVTMAKNFSKWTEK